MKIVFELSEIEQAAHQFVEALNPLGIVAFHGTMGAGKTTFIRAVCQELGVRDTVTSPTFAIVNEYSSPQGAVYHFDFYRLRRAQEALDIGLDEYLQSGRPCLMEWPELIQDFLPEETVNVEISENPDGTRTVEFLKGIRLYRDFGISG